MIQRVRSLTYTALRWSERYTKTDMVYLTQGGFWLILSRVIAVLAGFAMSVAFANLMEPEKYGVFKYVLSMVSIAGTFSLVGMGTAVNRAAAKGFEGALREGFSSSLRWSIGVVIAAGAMAGYYFLNGNATIAISILVGGTLTPLISAASLYDNFLGGMRHFRAKTVYNLIRTLIPIVALVTALYFSNDPIILSATYFLMTLGVTVWCYRDVLQRFKPHSATDSNETLTYSKHLSFLGIVNIIIAQLDRVLIFSQLGGTALAIFAFAEAGPDQLRGLGSVIGSLAFPKMSERPFKEIRDAIYGKAFILFVLAIGITALYIAIAPLFFALFFPKYLASVLYSQVYALTIPFALTSVLFNQALLSHMKKKELYINGIFPQAFRVVALLVLVALYGIWGIIFGTIGYYVVGFVLLIWTFHNTKDISVQTP